MIKLPREVKKVIKALEESGYDAFAVGGCVRDSLVGLKPFDWDIATSCHLEDMVKIFPEAKVISEKYGVIRLEYIEELFNSEGEFQGEEGIVIDIATFRKDGAYSDGRRPDQVDFVNTIEEDLPRRDFTMNTVADNGSRLVDLYGGRDDISKKIIKTVGDAGLRFKEDPVRMLRAIRFVAELGFDLSKEVFEGISENYKLLEKVSTDRFRSEFIRIMGSNNPGKGLRLIMETGIFSLIIGEAAYSNLSRRERSDLVILCDNLHKTKPIAERRLGLLYTSLNRKTALASIEKFQFDKELNQNLVDAVYDMAKLYFKTNKKDLKKFIYNHGWDRYDYLANLEKAQRIVFDYDSKLKIEGKMHWVKEMKNNGEAIFIEDLAIDGNDLIEAGICKGKDVGKMLTLLVETVHTKPALNRRIDLLNLARKYKINKLAAYMRGIKWLR